MNQDHKAQLVAIVEALITRTLEGRLEWQWDDTLSIGTAMLANGQVVVSKDTDLDTVILFVRPPVDKLPAADCRRSVRTRSGQLFGGGAVRYGAE